jgi:shikimate dehydrogenase
VPAITGATRLAAVIGDPARHSLSPTIHNAAFRALDLDAIYLAFDVPRGQAAAALRAARTLGLMGLSVTMPHKAEVAAALAADDAAVLDTEAAALGAVNCVINRDGCLHGSNTDGEGFLRGLRHDAGTDPRGHRAVVFGAGGAARAVIRALALAGAAEIVVVNRSAAAAGAAVALGGPVARAGAPDAVAGADLVVNATPVGMAGPLAGRLPCPAELLGSGQVVVDLVYHPLETPLLAAARERGARAHNGVSMLVFQAAAQFERWTGHPAPVDAMVAAVLDRLRSRGGRAPGVPGPEERSRDY